VLTLNIGSVDVALKKQYPMKRTRLYGFLIGFLIMPNPAAYLFSQQNAGGSEFDMTPVQKA
jgi:hypothetical protein